MNTLESALAGIEQMTSKTTEGPWWSGVGDVGGQIYVNAPDMCEGEPTQAVVCRVSWPHAKMESDGEFIAASRTLVPALVKALRTAVEQRNYHMENCRLGYDYQKREDAKLAAILADGREGL